MMACRQHRKLHRKSLPVKLNAREEPLSTSPVEILSLRKVSTAYVIAHLEEFPPETLALLPLRIRHELLLSLPPADILQLEHTRVVNGIDTEEIWKEVSQRYDFKLARREYPQPSEWVGGCIPTIVQPTGPFPEAIETSLKAARNNQISCKAYMLACIYALLLHLQPFPVMNVINFRLGYYSFESGLDIVSRNFLILLQLLFCMRFLILHQFKSSKFSPWVHFQNRYAHFFNSRVELADLLSFLFEKCHLEPPDTLLIDDRYFVWNQTAALGELEPVIHQFFSRVKEVKLVVHCGYQPPSAGYRPQPPVDPIVAAHKISWIFDAMLSCSTPMLQSLTIIEHVHYYKTGGCMVHPQLDFKFLKLVIAILAENFGTPGATPNSISKLPQCRSLQHICIIAGGYIDLAAFCNIIGIIQMQNLVTFSISGPCFEHCAEHLFPDLPQALGTYFLPVFPPSLSSITFKHIRNVPLSLLLWLIHKFLYSPGNGHQEMIFDVLTIDYEKIPTMQQFEQISSDRLTLPHKSLILKIEDMKASFFELLSQFPSLFLDTLEIHFRITFQGTKVSSNFDVQAIGAFVNHPMSRIQTQLYFLNFSRNYIDSADRNRTTKYSVVCESFLVFVKALFSQSEHLSNVELNLTCRSSATCQRDDIQELVCCLHTIWEDVGNGRKLRKIVLKTNSQSLGDKHDHDAAVMELKIISNTVEVSCFHRVKYC